MDRLLAVEDAQGNIWYYEYDELGNISAVSMHFNYMKSFSRLLLR